MISIDLTPDEQILLREMIGAAYSDLRMEIANTDSLDFRDHLRERKAVLQKVLDALGQGTAQTSLP